MIMAAVFQVAMVVLIVLSHNSDATATRPPPGSPSTWCRMNEGVSRCVDAPLKKNKLPKEIRDRLKERADGNWCPFRVCGPSYINTQACPSEEELKPIGQCSVKTIRSKVNMCLKGFTDSLAGDVACDVLGGNYCGVGPVYICKCNSRSVRQDVYELKNSRKPNCSSWSFQS